MGEDAESDHAAQGEYQENHSMEFPTDVRPALHGRESGHLSDRSMSFFFETRPRNHDRPNESED